ncbi:hypothetical protein Acor_50640 [Acrocarpospora corrugata]|uniref:Uncharacterized protein n=1 Tax=Acrocarpospora corrugata TaxID=35763 RepID=A0A5M3W922_9ACTN|nr:hypothetical protein Acor_50640 [Acrocarpospora corrugata]
MPPDYSKALTRPQVATVLELDVPLPERVLWTLLYERRELLGDLQRGERARRCSCVARRLRG